MMREALMTHPLDKLSLFSNKRLQFLYNRTMKASPFNGRPLLIATQHGKEQVIAPVLERVLGVECFSNSEFDTNTLGTFSGEVERTLDPLAAARAKCLHAMEAHQCDLAVASEGSFGPHPAIPFAQADDELLICIDKKLNLEIVVRALSMDTNFNAMTIRTKAELLEFAKKVQCPEHGIVLRPEKEVYDPIYKGITSLEELVHAFKTLKYQYENVYAETDMRAMVNPSRMKVIGEAAEKLAEKMASRCPECDRPGFGITEVQKGLPCGWCGQPTNSILKHIYKCQGCSFSKTVLHPKGKTKEDPMYCDFCNP